MNYVIFMTNNSEKITEFQKKVYEITSRIPKGHIATYQQIAELTGNKGSARAVGNALNINPFDSKIVPCHRVIKSNGEVGGYASGTKNKIEKLINEGIAIDKGKINLNKFKFNFRELEE
jgi:methylated-DNA-[protein]-cysteine S-methyltransferase